MNDNLKQTKGRKISEKESEALEEAEAADDLSAVIAICEGWLAGELTARQAKYAVRKAVSV